MDRFHAANIMSELAGVYRHSLSKITLDVRHEADQLLLKVCHESDDEYKINLNKGTIMPQNPGSVNNRVPPGQHISFFFSKNGVVKKLVWKKHGTPNPLQFDKVTDHSAFLKLPDLPEEILETIFKIVLTTNDGNIHMREEGAQIRIAHCDTIPTARKENGLKKGLAADYHSTGVLPNSWNALQYTCRKFFELTRGRELRYNHLQVSGWTFDTFRRLDQEPEKPTWFIDGQHWFSNVRAVTLVGQFGITRTSVDENILHGILRFGHEHPKVKIKVRVEDLCMNTGTFPAFLNLAFLIREAVRGVPRPQNVAPKNKDFVKHWRGNLKVADMDVRNIQFIPSNELNMKRVQDMMNNKSVLTQRIKDLLGSGKLVELVKGWYEDGI